MRAHEIMERDDGSNWLNARRHENAERLAAEWPDIHPGMFVQLKTWFGDVWAEITSVYLHWDKPEMRSVSYVSYEKYGVTRKERSVYFGDIRKFATADQITFARDIVHMPDAHYSFGEKTEWPKGPHRRDRGGYEIHPTKEKPVR